MKHVRTQVGDHHEGHQAQPRRGVVSPFVGFVLFVVTLVGNRQSYCHSANGNRQSAVVLSLHSLPTGARPGGEGWLN
jgi:hypothetical protein